MHQLDKGNKNRRIIDQKNQKQYKIYHKLAKRHTKPSVVMSTAQSDKHPEQKYWNDDFFNLLIKYM